MKLYLTDTTSGKKREFLPQNPECVNLYVCGITPYSHSHLGHARSAINFDLLARTLLFWGYKIQYIRNFTDIDDKLLIAAEQNGSPESYLKIADFFISEFQSQMQALNCLIPTQQPKATHYIPAMIEIIQTLLSKGAAYALDGDIYFDIAKCSNYGQFSGQKLDDLQAGQRVELATGKRNAGDFVLWKGEDEKVCSFFWQTPFGYGRPGWHTECTAMIMQLSPNGLDIHGGGQDLIFPHHENEIAQWQAAFGKPLSNFWMHNALLNLQNIKMSKSLGNTLTLPAILERINPMVLRFYLLQHGLRTPIEFQESGIQDASLALDKLKKMLTQPEATSIINNLADAQALCSKLDPEMGSIGEQLLTCLADDLNSPKLIGLLFKHQNIIASQPQLKLLALSLMEKVLGIDFTQVNLNATAEQRDENTLVLIEKMIAERKEARLNKNWQLADQLRNQLLALGHLVQDDKL